MGRAPVPGSAGVTASGLLLAGNGVELDAVNSGPAAGKATAVAYCR